MSDTDEIIWIFSDDFCQLSQISIFLSFMMWKICQKLKLIVSQFGGGGRVWMMAGMAESDWLFSGAGWGWVRLHPCCTLSKQYAQVKPAITSYTLRESYPAWQHRAPGYVSLSISFSQHHLPAALSGGAQFKSPMWFVACALPQLCYIFLLFRMHQ